MQGGKLFFCKKISVAKQKLWQKGVLDTSGLAEKVEKFTVGKDRELDLLLAKYDVLGSIAHITMLSENGLLESEALSPLKKALQKIYSDIESGQFSIGEGIEDVHSEVEFRLTGVLGDLGKKIHSGRSRNDQVLVDLKMFTRAEIEKTVELTHELFRTLIRLSNEHQHHLLPGYTHLQIAMISSFGLWLGAYAESLVDDVQQLSSAFYLANKNPLGSGAGYGGSLPLNRKRTTELLGFEDLNYNVVYAQMNRGKMERTVATALASVAATLGRLAMDMCLYINQNFGFISFPDVLTTGSSIMPHKKNPDVWELIRARCNQMQNLPVLINHILLNLPSGYHRDMQQIKENYMPAFGELNACLEMANIMLQHMEVKENILDDAKYLYLFSVEEVNRLVMEGMPFREAYVKVGKDIEAGVFEKPSVVAHTHEGSLGNLCNDQLERMMDENIKKFPFQSIKAAFDNLLA